jgi:hypothetical protein
MPRTGRNGFGKLTVKSVLWIRIADPDPEPAFYLSVDPDQGSQPMRAHANPDPWILVRL